MSLCTSRGRYFDDLITSQETANANWEDVYGDQSTINGAFKGAIYRTTMVLEDGAHVQDQAFRLASQGYHYPKTNLVTLRGSKNGPKVHMTSRVKGEPGWRKEVMQMPVADQLFPLHSPSNYVNWLGDEATPCGFSVGASDVTEQ